MNNKQHGVSGEKKWKQFTSGTQQKERRGKIGCCTISRRKISSTTITAAAAAKILNSSFYFCGSSSFYPFVFRMENSTVFNTQSTEHWREEWGGRKKRNQSVILLCVYQTANFMPLNIVPEYWSVYVFACSLFATNEQQRWRLWRRWWWWCCCCCFGRANFFFNKQKTRNDKNGMNSNGIEYWSDEMDWNGMEWSGVALERENANGNGDVDGVEKWVHGFAWIELKKKKKKCAAKQQHIILFQFPL